MRRQWVRRQGGLDPQQLVFIDESAAKINLACLHGCSPWGERLPAQCPHGHWRTTTMMSSICMNGSTACLPLKGATDTNVFQV